MLAVASFCLCHILQTLAWCWAAPSPLPFHSEKAMPGMSMSCAQFKASSFNKRLFVATLTDRNETEGEAKRNAVHQYKARRGKARCDEACLGVAR